MGFERYAVVRVPFPFTDRNASKNRPALVLSDDAAFNTPAGHSVMAMITTAANPPWPLDCPITDMAAAGHPSSAVRGLIFVFWRAEIVVAQGVAWAKRGSAVVSRIVCNA